MEGNHMKGAKYILTAAVIAMSSVMIDGML